MSQSLSHSPAHRSRLAVAAALALGCSAGITIAQDASTAPTLSARRIVIDSVTGRPRMPDHEDFAAMKQEAAAQRAAAPAARGAAPQTQPQFSSHPVLARMQGQAVATKFGAAGRRVGAEKLSFSVVQRAADGSFQTRCVAGEDAATHALHAQATKEDGHAQ
jgi:hypothetical protein